MGTTQDLHALRRCLAAAHDQLQQAQGHVRRLREQGGCPVIVERRMNALIEDARDQITDASSTLRALEIPSPVPIGELVQAEMQQARARTLSEHIARELSDDTADHEIDAAEHRLEQALRARRERPAEYALEQQRAAACSHEGIGRPGCPVCDPRGAETAGAVLERSKGRG